MHSALYPGWLSHHRHTPRAHSFRYRVMLAWLDLSELDSVFRGRWLWSTRRWAPVRFDRRNHLGDLSRPLDDCVRSLIAEHIGIRPSGAIRLLTHLSYFGYCFNPVSFYYCYEGQGADERLIAVVAEVNNTPWGERHCYVLDAATATAQADGHRFHFSKEFHVSPFMPMDLIYDWRLGTPHQRLDIRTALVEDDKTMFDAVLNLKRVEITASTLACELLACPAMTFKVIVAIYWQAFRLWLKRTPFHPHPSPRP